VSTVLFYISGHGFGHASRAVEVINALGRRGYRILIRSAVSPSLLARTLRVPYELVPGECDTGIVQVTSIENDDAATIAAATEFYRDFPARVHDEMGTVGGRDVHLVVGDIAPLAFAVAARLGVPGIAIANFTWDWIYETHPGFLPAGAPVISTIRAAYWKATRAWQLPFSAGLDVFAQVSPLPLIARRPSVPRETTRRHLGWPLDRKIALASFGGYGLPRLDLGQLDCAHDWTIATTDRVSPNAGPLPAHVTYLSEDTMGPDGLRYEDIIAAVDAVVTKPGFGILAECVATGTPMLYTSRGVFREYDVLVAEMPRYVRCRFIAPADLLAGRWRAALDTLLAQPPPTETMAVNGADVAADRLAEWLPPRQGRT
jgi:L-arabinokinase